MPRKARVNRARQKTAVKRVVKPQSSETAIVPHEVLDGQKVITLRSIADMRRGRVLGTRLGLASRVRGGEYGASGTLNVFGQIYNDDYNALFDGKNGIEIYNQMNRSDGQIGAATDIICLPIRAARWRAVPPEDDATPKEKELADLLNEFVFDNGDWPSQESWDFYLRHLLMRVPFGFGLVEKVWMFDEDAGILRFKRLAPRLPRTVERFHVNPDGTLRAIEQYAADAGTGMYNYKTIPSDYAVLSVRDREGDNFFGKSIYRRIYKHWFYKDDAYRIDGIRIDRYGVGIPVAKIEEGHVLEDDELNEIEMTLMALRSHERAYIIEPPKVTFRIMTPENGTGGVAGLMDSVKHHDEMITRSILATFLNDHAEGLNTNRTRTLADIFLHALTAEAKAIAGDVRSQLVRPFCDFNFDMSDARYPAIEVSGIGDLTVEQLATVLGPFVSAKLITPDDDLESVLRKLLGFGPLPDGLKRGDEPPAPALPQPAPDPNNPDNPDPQPQDPQTPPKPVANELAQSFRQLAQALDPPTPRKKRRSIERDPVTKRITAFVEEDVR
jgi:hypothetical protein